MQKFIPDNFAAVTDAMISSLELISADFVALLSFYFNVNKHYPFYR